MAGASIESFRSLLLVVDVYFISSILYYSTGSHDPVELSPLSDFFHHLAEAQSARPVCARTHEASDASRRHRRPAWAHQPIDALGERIEAEFGQGNRRVRGVLDLTSLVRHSLAHRGLAHQKQQLSL